MVLPPFAIFSQLGTPELLIIAFVILLLFGAKRLPDLFRSFGKSIGEFKRATRDIEDDIRTAMDEEPDEKEKPKAGSAHKPAETQKPAESSQEASSSSKN
ncbi:MAG: Sec-independent protein translocase subunit TatA/TatB [Opitutales bacterium]